ncbi:putative selenium-dependent hydroxylase accessory protein YqeC [Halorarum halophilum]|uniref:Putative selenium-dependent hydroxylase accessory protein YqeC n=1 Tax=Halorarum halophilum TaxID=2743090 RepID=A0A7D5KDW7_9EURY|nr:selenium cofactor biosynthesis protein YqeC [Halobaculum halophilum]QLG27777.1 putative selenium-dependent hydroxylase accessory protein YqeC [Halobaculum halophilum]
MTPAEALPSDGLVAVVGAGGKKTTLYALAGATDRAVVTATVRIPIFDEHVARVEATDDPIAALADADAGDFPLGLVPEQERPDRYRGYDRDVVDGLAAAHDDPVFVKADGARMREFKAPSDREPQVPDGADAVIPVASVHAVGKPLTGEVVHRPERVSAITGIDVGEEITAEAVGAVLASTGGGLKGVPEGATVVPLVNKVDDEGDEQVAREVAEAAMAADESGRIDRVVLARMLDGTVVDVIR